MNFMQATAVALMLWLHLITLGISLDTSQFKVIGSADSFLPNETSSPPSMQRTHLAFDDRGIVFISHTLGLAAYADADSEWPSLLWYKRNADFTMLFGAEPTINNMFVVSSESLTLCTNIGLFTLDTSDLSLLKVSYSIAAGCNSATRISIPECPVCALLSHKIGWWATSFDLVDLSESRIPIDRSRHNYPEVTQLADTISVITGGSNTQLVLTDSRNVYIYEFRNQNYTVVHPVNTIPHSLTSPITAALPITSFTTAIIGQSSVLYCHVYSSKQTCELTSLLSLPFNGVVEFFDGYLLALFPQSSSSTPTNLHFFPLYSSNNTYVTDGTDVWDIDGGGTVLAAASFSHSSAVLTSRGFYVIGTPVEDYWWVASAVCSGFMAVVVIVVCIVMFIKAIPEKKEVGEFLLSTIFIGVLAFHDIFDLLAQTEFIMIDAKWTMLFLCLGFLPMITQTIGILFTGGTPLLVIKLIEACLLLPADLMIWVGYGSKYWRVAPWLFCMDVASDIVLYVVMIVISINAFRGERIPVKVTLNQAMKAMEKYSKGKVSYYLFLIVVMLMYLVGYVFFPIGNFLLSVLCLRDDQRVQNWMLLISLVAINIFYAVPLLTLMKRGFIYAALATAAMLPLGGVYFIYFCIGVYPITMIWLYFVIMLSLMAFMVFPGILSLIVHPEPDN